MNAVLDLVGRIFLCLIFLMSALGNKIPNFGNVSTYMASEDVPAPSFLLVGAIVFLVFGSASVILGYKARIGAMLLLAFLILATYFFHDFWLFKGDRREQEMINFMKNLALMGAMLIVIARGAGPLSVDGKRRGGGK